MANKKVSELITSSSVLSTDYIVIDRPAGTQSAQLSAVANYVLNQVSRYGGLKYDSSGLYVDTRISSDVTTNYTLSLSNSNQIVGVSSSNPITIMVPLDSTQNFTIGTNIVIYQKGTGQITISPENVNVKILSYSNKLKLTGQYSSIALFKLDSNSWLLGGDLTT
jgi:hypothetical protein